MKSGRTKLGVALVLAIGSIASGAQAGPATPEQGFYSLAVLNGAITGPHACWQHALFSSFSGGISLFWPGSGSTGAVLRKAELSNLTLQLPAHVRVATLPKMPVAGATNWSGDFTSIVVPKGNAPTDGTWAAKLTYVDSGSFSATLTMTVKIPAGTCIQTSDVVFLRTG